MNKPYNHIETFARKMILLSGKAKMRDQLVGTNSGSFAGRRPSAKEGASPKREFIGISNLLGTFLTRHESKMVFVQRSHILFSGINNAAT
ncbi:MAG: hypothetical protein ACI9NY_000585 [Kiritimatiellia bacterium]|jgi:hypothetical protein